MFAPGSYAVIKVAGADPETFLILVVTDEASRHKGYMYSGTDFLGEKQARGRLKEMGFDSQQIDALIKKARENPR
jgi:phage gp45-like